ncbi:MAG TPA: hypothetical protein VFY92_04905 [Hyphomicrobiaceae bacterium]|nr:hypothetical protein [Hyphomicrobiaceae bacterium]
MRRITLMGVALIAGAALIPALRTAPASALPLPALQQHTSAAEAGLVQHVRRGGFRGGHGFRGGGFRGHAFRGGGFRGHAFRGGAFRGGGWRGGRHWSGRRWGRAAGWGLALGALGAPYYGYGYTSCPLVRRTVWTPRGWRVRWVRRCW